MIARSGQKIKTKLGMLLYGDAGCWKSSFCLESLKLKTEDGRPFRVLYLDSESGSIDSYIYQYEDMGYSLQNLFIAYTQSVTEIKELLKKVRDNEDFYEYDEFGEETDTVLLDADGKPFRPDMIVIDSLSILHTAKQSSLIELSKKRATVKAKNQEKTGMEKEVMIENANLELRDWSSISQVFNDLCLDLLSCGKHFICTAREKEITTSQKDIDGSIKTVHTGKYAPDGVKSLKYNFKTVIRMFKDEDGLIYGLIDSKDRTGVHEQNKVLLEPTLTDWQVAIDRNVGLKDYIVKNTYDDSINREIIAAEQETNKYDNMITESDSASKTFSTPEEYHVAIKAAIVKLPTTEKAKKQSAIMEAGLPKAYQKITDLDQLKNYLEIVS